MNPIATRTLFLGDLENEVGGPDAPSEAVRRCLQVLFSEVIGFRPGDHFIAGLSHYSAKKWLFNLLDLPIQWRLGSGPDGAERAVIESLDIDHYAAAGFTRVVLLSGDHAWLPVVVRAREVGMQVHLVAGRGRVSKALRAACPTYSRIREFRRGQNRVPLALRPSIVPPMAA